jgi:hypothetical protein
VDFYHHGLHWIGVDSQHFSPAEVGEIARALPEGFESDALKPPFIETIPFEDAVNAYAKVASGQANLKQVLTFS